MINDTLQDNGVPPFTVEVIRMVVLRSNNGDMAPIYCTSALREAPSVFKALHNLMQVISPRKLDVLRHEYLSNCSAELLDNGTHCRLGYAK